MLVWMDLEMTGLDHTRDQIVEIATIVTDDELRIIAEGPDLVVHADEAILATMDPIVFDMHTKSGLLPAIRASTVTIEEAGAATLDFIRAHVPDPRTVPLCGNSIGTDRRFLDKYLPEIENYLHYRSVDVSSVKELVKRWYPDLTQAMPRKAGLHRALDDIRSSIEELRYYRGVVFVPPVAVAVATDDAATTAINAEVVTVDPDDEVFTVDPDDEVFTVDPDDEVVTVDPDGQGEPTAR